MPSLMVANHLSYLDPLLILAHASGVPICKDSVGRWPIIGTGARVLGVLLVNRACMMNRAAVLRQAIRTLKSGVRVLNFPEGTTTDGCGEMKPFHRGMFGAARIAGVPVVPVALRFDSVDLTWTGDQYFLPHYLATAARSSSSFQIEWGKPIAPWSEPNAEALARRARHAILDLLQRGLHEPRERVRLLETRPDPIFSPPLRQAR
jgi:1-acyl-sn-glycerol-3-phosphate acyltransferase